MGLTARLAEAAAIKARCIGSLELIASRDVEAFLRVARDQRAAIVGIEGFRVQNEHAIPDTDSIADFSDIPTDENLVDISHEEARRFLRKVSASDMYFEFEILPAASSLP